MLGFMMDVGRESEGVGCGGQGARRWVMMRIEGDEFYELGGKLMDKIGDPAPQNARAIPKPLFVVLDGIPKILSQSEFQGWYQILVTRLIWIIYHYY